MLRDEYYFFILLISGVAIVFIALYGVNRWFVRKNRVESIHERKELLDSDDSSSK